MQPKFTLRHFLAFAGSSLLGISSATAADFFWDGGTADILVDGNGASAGTAGTWDTTLLNWDEGASPHVAWNNSNNDTAIFAGTAGIITLGTDITAGGLTFNTNGYSIAAGNILTLAGASTPVVNVSTGGSTISSQISGSDGLQKEGTGVLLLNGTNDYTGGTVIKAGRLNASSDAALGDANGSITLDGGTLGANRGTGTGRANGVNLTSIRDVIVGTSGGSIFVSKNNNFTTTGALSGSGVFTTSNPGGSGGISIYRFTSSNNTFTGSMTLNVADIRVSSLGDTAGNNIVFTGASSSFRFNDTGATAGLTFNNRAFELSNVSATIGNLNTTHAFTINSNLVATGSAAKTLTLNSAAGPTNIFAGAIANETDGGTGTVALTKSGAGTWELQGANSYTGNTTVSAGTLTLAASSSTQFLIGASEVNNAILGTGTANLDGMFVFDLTSASTSVGDFWGIVGVGSLSESYGSTFGVNSTLGSFSEAGGIWSIDENGRTYEFSQTTGVLTVIPEPAAALLGGLGLLVLLRRRR